MFSAPALVAGCMSLVLVSLSKAFVSGSFLPQRPLRSTRRETELLQVGLAMLGIL